MFERSRSAGLDRITEGSEPGEVDAPEIDFGAIDAATNSPESPSDHPLLTTQRNRDLDSSLRRVPVDRLHPDRLREASAEQNECLAEARERTCSPDEWVGLINPNFLEDVVAGRSGATTNCADCARCVQETWEGRPRAAAMIDDRGLPLEIEAEGGGENGAYTEQWAGSRFLAESYESIGRRVGQDQGSAIVAAFGETGGHAFNAIWHDGQVKLVDGQIGIVQDWNTSPYVAKFDTFKAIYFTNRSIHDQP